MNKAANQIAAELLSMRAEGDERSFDELLWECMGLVGECTGAQRVCVWRVNCDEYTLFCTYTWESSKAGDYVRICDRFEIKHNMFEAAQLIFRLNEPIHGGISDLSEECRGFFGSGDGDVKSGAAIPVFLRGEFWGLMTVEHISEERLFTDDEVGVLSAIALMFANSVEQESVVNKLARKYEEAKTETYQYRAILDAIPLPVSVTGNDLRWTFVNNAVEIMLGATRDEIIGEHCSSWGKPICGTKDCAVACFEQGVKCSHFTQNNFSFRTDTEALLDIRGEKIGYVEVVQDITQIETMAKRHSQAEAANAAKSAFLAAMSHEIRTPMNTILGIAEIQLKRRDIAPQSAEAFGQIFDAGELLLALVNDILDLSKIESGKMEMYENPYNLPTLIGDAAHFNYVRFESKPVDFKIAFSEDAPLELVGDEAKIKQVLNNILSNAFKYTEAGTVELSAAVECPYGLVEGSNAFLNITVRDTGQGMSEKQARECFNDFTRFNPELNRGKEGTGLGMGITKNLVEAMGGTIELQSKSEKGTIVTIRIPQKICTDSLCGAEISERLRNLNFRERRRISGAAHSDGSVNKQSYMPYGRVLVVDDIQMNLLVAKGFMSAYSVQIDTASSGREAIAKAEQRDYDIIFMDHMMPGIDGIEATEMLRQKGYTKPIIALTANAIIGQKEIFLSHGFDGYITKPIDSNELDGLFNKYVRDVRPPHVHEKAQLELMAQEEFHSVQQHKSAQISGIFELLDVVELQKYFAIDAAKAVAVFRLVLGKDSPTEGDFTNYTVSAHGMKSALKNLGRAEFSEKAAFLENAGKSRNITVMRMETPALIDILEELISVFTVESSGRTSETSQICEKTDEILRGKLTLIAKACASLDITAAHAASEALKQILLPANLREKLDGIDINLLESDFDAAADAAQELLTSLQG